LRIEPGDGAAEAKYAVLANRWPLIRAHQGLPDWQVYACYLHARQGIAFRHAQKAPNKASRNPGKWQLYGYFLAALCFAGQSGSRPF
jgi:hypothetical protein